MFPAQPKYNPRISGLVDQRGGVVEQVPDLLQQEESGREPCLLLGGGHFFSSFAGSLAIISPAFALISGFEFASTDHLLMMA